MMHNHKVIIDGEYKPSEDEPFMNSAQLEYFKKRLLRWRDQLLQESEHTMQELQAEHQNEADPLDWASEEVNRAAILKTRDRERKLLSKIEIALQKISDGTYGYCEETGEPIGIKRLEARPVATLSIEAQEMRERQERLHLNTGS